MNRTKGPARIKNIKLKRTGIGWSKVRYLGINGTTRKEGRRRSSAIIHIGCNQRYKKWLKDLGARLNCNGTENRDTRELHVNFFLKRKQARPLMVLFAMRYPFNTVPTDAEIGFRKLH